MPKGLNSYDKKHRRKIRRRNHIAKDLFTPKYRIRTKDSKKPIIPYEPGEEEFWDAITRGWELNDDD